MNAPFVVAQVSSIQSPADTPVRTIKLTKPQGSQSITVNLDNATKLDLSDIASEKITFVRVGNRLIILFDNQSTVTVDPFFDSAGLPRGDVNIELAADRIVTGNEFATLFPITTDQSILPAAGEGGSPQSGANFSDPSVQALTGGTPLDLLGDTAGQGSEFGAQEATNTVPVIGSPSAGLVDDEGLSEGLVGGLGDTAGESPSVTGSLDITAGNDVPLTLSFAATQPSLTGLTAGGQTVAFIVTTIAGQPAIIGYIGADPTIAGNQVYTITLDNAGTGSYTFTLLQPLDHPITGTEDTIDLTIGFTVADSNGDTDSATFGVSINDDSSVIGTPAGATIDEDDLQNGNGDDATGDDDTVTDGDLDGDGDAKTVSGALGISWGADNYNTNPNGGVTGAHVDGDRAVVFAANAIATLTALGLTSDGIALAYTVSADGTTLTATKAGDQESEGIDEIVFTVSLSDTGTGAFTFTLVGNLDHPDTTSEDNLALTFNFTATDSDGDPQSSSFTVNVDDDGPTFGGEIPSAPLLDEEGLNAVSDNNGDSYSDSGDVAGETVSDGGSLGILWGADDGNAVADGGIGSGGPVDGDRAVTFASSAVSELQALNLTSNGVGLTFLVSNNGTLLTAYRFDDGQYIDGQGAVIDEGPSSAAAVFTMALTDTGFGGYEFTLLDNLDHPDANTEDDVTIDFDILATDSDGDTQTTTVTVTVDDDAPVIGSIGSALVDEDDLANGIGDDQAGDDDTLTDDTIDTDPNPLTVAGNLAIAWGADDANSAANGGISGSPIDGDRAVTFAASTLTTLAGMNLTADGVALVYALSANDTVLTASKIGSGEPVFTVSLSDTGTGSYTFTLIGNLDHPSADAENNIDLTFSFVATDSDGDTQTSSFTVNVIDDSPVAGVGTGSTVEDEAVNGGNDETEAPDLLGAVVNVSLNIAWGADDANDGDGQPGDRAVAFTDEQVAVSGAYGAALTSLGRDVHTAILPNGTLIGYTGSPAPSGIGSGRVVFYATLSDANSGEYSFTLKQPLDHADDAGNGENALSLTFNYTATDSDGDTASNTFTVDVVDDVPLVSGTFQGGTVEEEQPVVQGAGNEDIGPDPQDADYWGSFFGFPIFRDVTTQTTGGTLGVSWGSDNADDENGQPGDRSVAFASTAMSALDGLDLTSRGAELHYTLIGVPGGQVLVAYTGATVPTVVPANASAALAAHIVFMAGLSDNASGSYAFTLFDTIDNQSSVQGEDALTLGFQFVATDSDGDTTDPATFNVTVIDDVPTAAGTILARTVEEEALSGGNEDVQPVGLEVAAAIVNGGLLTDQIGASLNIAWGGDDSNVNANGGYTGTQAAGDRSVVFGGTGGAFIADGTITAGTAAQFVSVSGGSGTIALADLTSGGEHLIYALSNNGSVLTATTAVSGETVFTVTLSDAGAGSYLFDLDRELDHPVTGTGAGQEDQLTFSFTFTARDGDGDVATAGFTVNVIDDSPVAGTPDSGALVEDTVAVPLANASFEAQSLAAGQPGIIVDVKGNYTYGSPAGWTISGGTGGLFNPADTIADNDGHAGGNVAWLRNGALLAQDTGEIIGEGEIYTIRLNVADRTDQAWPGGEVRLVATDGVTSVVLASLALPTPPNGDWTAVELSSAAITAARAAALAGYHIRVEIQQTSPGSGNQILVDNIELSTMPATTDTGSLDVSWGADNDPSLRTVAFTASLADDAAVDTANGPLTSNDKTVRLVRVSDTELLGVADDDDDGFVDASGRIVFRVTLDDGATSSDEGTWRFTLLDNVDHLPFGNDTNLSLAFGFTATDADGDSAAASSFTVDLSDDTPILVGSVTTGLTLDEDDLPTGNDATKETLSVNGNLNIDLGADDGGIALSAANADWDAGTRTLSADDGAWKIVLNGDGTYTFTLLDNTLLHGPGDNGENPFDVTVTYTAADGDTDVLTGNFNVSIVDDVPVIGTITGPSWYSQNFNGTTDVPTSGWVDGGGNGDVDIVPSGTGGIVTADGGNYARITQTGSGPFTRFDDHKTAFLGGFKASVDIYLDINWALGSGFDYSVAASKQDGGHLRDFIFHVTRDSSTGDLLVGGSNNTNFNPREDLESLNHYDVNSSGWYTFEHVFRDAGDGSLAVDLILRNSAGVELWRETRNATADDIDTIVGGNRYGWFTNVDIAGGIAVDNVSLTPLGPVAALNEDDLSNGTDATKETISVTGGLAVAWGADDSDPDAGSADRHLVFTTNAAPAGLKSDGVDIVFDVTTNPDGNETLTAYKGVVDPANKVFTVVLDDNGSGTYTFTLIGNLDHPAGGGQNDLALTFGFRAIDADGDSDTASFQVNIHDDVPVSRGIVQNASVYETELSTGTDYLNPDDKNGDGDGGDRNYTGNLTALVSFGADGPAGFVVEVTNLAPELLALTSGGVSLSYSLHPADPTILLATANGIEIFNFQVDANTGQYSFRLKGPLDHLGGNDGSITLDLSSAVTARDGDGDTLPLSGQINITVTDDTPTTSQADRYVNLQEGDIVSGAPDTPDADSKAFTVDFGADGYGATAFTGAMKIDIGPGLAGNIVFDVSSGSYRTTVLTSDGRPITFVRVDDNTIRGYVASADNGDLGDIDVIEFKLNDVDTNVTVQLFANVDHVAAQDGSPISQIRVDATIAFSDADGDVVTSIIRANLHDDTLSAPDGMPATPATTVSEDVALPALADIALGIDWGQDAGNDDNGQPGDRSVAFSSAAVSLAGSGPIGGLTSFGVPVTIAYLNGDTTKLVAYTGPTPPTLGTEPSIVFLATLSDVASGSYSFELRQPLDHPTPDAVNDLHFIDLTFAYTATDGDKDTDAGAFTVRVDAAGTIGSIHYDALSTGVFVNLSDVTATAPFSGQTTAANTATDIATVVDKVIGIDQLGTTIVDAYGGSAGDVLIGGNEDNILDGNGGADILLGNQGADTIYGDEGADYISGGGGGDTIYGGADNDQIGGDRGDDVIYGDGGSDTIQGGEENDTIYGGADNDTLGGGTQNDEIHGNEGQDAIDGGSGIDVAAYDATTLSAGMFSYDGANNRWVVTTGGTEGTDTLVNIESARGGDPAGAATGRFLLVGGGSEYTTIQAAVDAAQAGDTIMIAPGIWTGAGNVNVTIDKPLFIVGMGDGSDPATNTIISGGGFIIDLDADAAAGTVSFQNLAITNAGNAGISAQDQEILGTLALDHVRIEDAAYSGLIASGRKDSAAYDQAGVQNVVITNSTFVDNAQSNSNSANIMLFEFDGDATITNVTASNSVAGADSAAFGIQIAGFDGPLYDQLTPAPGSALQSYDVLTPMGTVTIDNLDVTGTTRKAGFYIQGYTDTSGLTITGSTVDVESTGWHKPVVVDPMADQLPTGVANDAGNSGSFFDETGANGSYDLSGLTVVQKTGQITELDGTTKADVIVGSNADDQITGFGGADTLSGSAGDDAILYRVGDGSDIVDGGADTDTLRIVSTAAGQTITLDAPPPSGFTVTSGADTAVVHDVEEVVVDFSAGSGTLNVTGDFAASGIDLSTISFVGGAGNDVLDASGMTGSSPSSMVGIDAHGNGGSDELRGGVGDDELYGDAGDDVLAGNGGDDLVDGGIGKDRISGGAGVNTLIGGGDDDQFFADGGNDTIYGNGSDTDNAQNVAATAGEHDNVVYYGAPSNFAVSQNPDGSWQALNTLNGQIDTLYGVEGIDFNGGGVDLDLTAPVQVFDGVNLIGTYGSIQAANDAASTLSGHRILIAGTVIGENATISKDNLTVEGQLDDSGNTLTLGSGVLTITLLGDAPFQVIGNGLANIINGNDGANRIVGGGGTDVLNGGDGDDTLVDGGGTAFHGGDGVDTVDLSVLTGRVDVNLDLLAGSGGYAAHAATFTGIENLILNAADVTGGDASNIAGNELRNVIQGSGRADNIFGLAGNDEIHGNGGDDVIAGGAGADSLSGDAGIDTLQLSVGAPGSTIHTVNLTTNTVSGGELDGDTISGFENVTASHNTRADFTGDGNANVLIGSNEDDVLRGEGGNDTLIGDSGYNGTSNADMLVGGSGDDRLKGGGGNDTLYGNDTDTTQAINRLAQLGEHDTALYDGTAANYHVTQEADGSFRVLDIAANRTDALYGVEGIDFGSNGVDLDLTAPVLLFDAANYLVGTYATITAAIVDAGATGYTLQLAAHDFNEGTIIVDKDVTIRGANAGIADFGSRGLESVITGRLVILADGVTIDGVKIAEGTEGGAFDKAGIHVQANNFVLVNNVLERLGPVDGDGYRGVVAAITGVAGLVISDNLFTGWATGVYLNPGATGAQVDHNVLSANYVGLSVDDPDGASIHDNAFNNNVFEQIGVGALDDPEDLSGQIYDNAFTGSAAEVTIYPSGANNQDITGTEHDDTLVATNNVQIVHGGDGDDTLNGGDGSDQLFGDAGNDTLDGGSMIDRLTGGEGNDTLIGGSDQSAAAQGDTAVYAGVRAGYDVDVVKDGSGFVTAFTAVTDTDTGTLDEGHDTLTGIEAIEFAGGTLNLRQDIQLFDAGGELIGTFDTIQAAVNAADAGHKILISAGTYNENVVIGEGITLTGIGAVVIDGGTTGPAVTVTGGGAGQNLVFDNLDLTGSGTSVLLIQPAADYDNVTFKNGDVTGGDYHGLFLDSAAGLGALTIQNVVFSGNATTESGASGEGAITIFKYNGNVTLQNVDVVSPGDAAENGIQLRGVDALAPMGTVVFDDVDVSGTYDKTGVAIYNYSNATGLSITGGGLDVNVDAGWHGFNIDGVGGTLNLSGVPLTVVNTHAGASNDIAMQGTGGGENFTADGSDDMLRGFGGGDTLAGGGGNDIFLLGQDVLGTGSRTFFLGDGTTRSISIAGLAGTQDPVSGGTGTDTILLDRGAAPGYVHDTSMAPSYLSGVEQIVGTDGTDVIFVSQAYTSDAGGGILIEGNAGTDSLGGGAGSDTLRGGADADLLSGLGGVDTLEGGGGNDEIWGGAGNDILVGGGDPDSTADRLYGNDGNDTLYGNEMSPLSGNNVAPNAAEDDRAIFTGVQSGYQVTANADGSYTVTDTSLGGGDDGTDTLWGIERLDFGNDGIVDLDLTASVRVYATGYNEITGVGVLIGTYTSIQAAVNAATDGQFVVVSSGIYTEQVVVDGKTDLTILEAPGATVTIEAPADLIETARSSSDRELNAVVTVKNSTNVDLKGITVDGDGRGNTIDENDGGGQANFIGVVYRNASGDLTNVDITGVHDAYPGGNTVDGYPNQSGTQRGVGLQVDNDTLMSFSMTGGSITDFQKNATVFNHADLDVTGVTVIGGGAQTVNAQNGFQATNSTGTIADNFISAIGYAGPQVVYSGGLLLYHNTNLNVTGNTITGTNGATTDGKIVGIYVFESGGPNSGGSITGNVISHVDIGIGVYDGITPNAIAISGNTVTALDTSDPYAAGVDFEPTANLAVQFDVTGTSFGDILQGAAAADTLTGLGGADYLEGRGGNDIIDAGAGDDLIVWNVTDGTDTVDGGNDSDTLRIVTTGSTSAALQVHGAAADFTLGDYPANALKVDATSVETIELAFNTSVSNEFFASGSADAARILASGTSAIDGAQLGLGNSQDRFFAGSSHATDEIDARGGNDFAVYTPVSNGTGGGTVLINLDTVAHTVGSETLAANTAAWTNATLGSPTYIDHLYNFENAEGGGGRDTLVGTGGVNQLRGNEGADTLVGLDGDDVLRGDAGDDMLYGNAAEPPLSGDDLLPDAAENDVAVYSGAQSGYQISLNGNGSYTVVDTNAGNGDDGIDTLYGIEGIDFGANGSVDVDLTQPVQLFDASGHLMGTYGDLKSAVDAANSDAGTTYTIHILAGTVDVGGSQVVIEKNITIDGAGMNATTLQADFDTGTGGDARGMILVTAGHTLNVSDLTIDGDGHHIWQGIRSFGSGDIDRVRFDDIRYQTDGQPYAGMAIAAAGGAGADVDVTDSVFTNIGRIGILYFGAGTTGTVTNLTYTGKGAGDWLDYAVEIGSGADVEVSGATISDVRGVAIADGSTSAGILATTAYGAGTSIDIAGVTVTDTTYGVVLGYGPGDTTAATFGAGNDLDAATQVGVVVTGDVTVTNSTNANGTFDWDGGAAVNAPSGDDFADTLRGGDGFDTITGHGGADTIVGGEGGEIYTPTLGEGDKAVYTTNLAATDITTSGSGWSVAGGADGTDALTGIEMVVDNGGQRFLLVGNGGFATIQDAVDEAQAGDTILIAAGTYAEQVQIEGSGKDGLSLIAVGGIVTIEAPATLVKTGDSPTSGRDIVALVSVEGADGVTIKGITVDGNERGGDIGSVAPQSGTLVGIAYLDSDDGVIDGVTVTEIRENDAGFGNQRGIGIYVINTDGTPEATPANGELAGLNDIEIKNSTVTDFQKGAIVVVNADVNIHDNTVTGIGGTTLTAQNGIQVVGSTGIVANNIVSGIGYTGASWAASLIIAYNNNGLVIDGNTLTGTGSTHLVIGVGVFDSIGAAVTDNTISQFGWAIDVEDYPTSYGWPEALLPGTGTVFTGNAFTSIGYDYLYFDPDAATAAPFTVTGTVGTDTIYGAAGDDTLNGGDGNDAIDGRGGDDVINAGAGDDTITYAVGDGQDTIDGGLETVAGSDTLDITNNGGATVFTIIGSGADPILIDTGGLVGAEISATEIEDIVLHLGTGGDTVDVSGTFAGTSLHTSTITVEGNGGEDIVDASALASSHRIVFTGGGGNDTFSSGGGDDSFDGGAGGTDRLVYADTFNPNEVSLSGGTLTIDASKGADTVTGVEQIKFDDTTVLVVDGSGAYGGYATIGAAVSAAAGVAGHVTILVAAGTYNENVLISRDDISLISIGGSDVTTISGIGSSGALGAIQLVSGTDHVQIGAIGHGFTVVGFDGTPGIENAAIYLQGIHDDIDIVGNNVVANGDAGLLSEYGQAITNVLVDHNEFSGQTFVGSEPSGVGFNAQFTLPDVPRQLVTLSAGSNVTFSNNDLTGTAGGLSIIGNNGHPIAPTPQGNTLATIDTSNSLITGNDVTGYTAGGGYGIRARGAGTSLTDNTLDDSTGGNSAGIFVNNQGTPGTYTGNVVNGGDGDEIITSMTPGDDVVRGGDGNDSLVGGLGNDTIDGGDGFDTVVYSGPSSGYDVTAFGGGDPHLVVTDTNHANGNDGTDTLRNVDRLTFTNGALDPVLLFDASGHLVNDFTTISAAIAAAANGQTIYIGAGTYNEHVVVNKSLTLIGGGDDTIIHGTFKSTNGLAEDASVADFLKTTPAYTNASGAGVTISADNVTLQNLSIDGFYTGIELGDGIDHTLIKNVAIESTVNGMRKGTAADVNDLDIVGGRIEDTYIGINFYKSATAGDGNVNDLTIDGTTFTHLTQKGIYTETLTGTTIFTGITMTDVGHYGGGPAFGHNGLHGNGIDINLKYETYAGSITIDDFAFSDVGVSNGLGTSHQNGAAISVKARDDAPSYSGVPASFIGTLTIQDGLIDGTSTGIRAGEAGKTTGGPAVTITDVTIANAEHSALHGDVANVTTSLMTIVMTDASETLVPSPTSTGSFDISGLGGDDVIHGGQAIDTLRGGDGNDIFYATAGDIIVEGSGPLSGIDEVRTTDSFVLAANVENLTLLDGASHVDDFSNFDLGPIANGENGWAVAAGGRDQSVVDIGGDKAFKMSSDPSVPDFAGPYSYALPVTAGEPSTTADYSGQSVSFRFQAVDPSGDNSRLEVDFGNEAGTDRNNFMLIESTAAGIRIAVNEPKLDGNWTTNDFSAFTGNVTLASGVSLTDWHEVELRLTYKDGANNDLIQVYLDGNFIGTTTTFENYRDALGGNHAANAEANQTNRLFFRPTAGSAAGDNDGAGGHNEGFYFDDVKTTVYDHTTATGNDLANTIIGNSGDNAIAGLAGNDTLTGGDGADRFVFTETGAANLDTILDYSVAQGDKIDLSALLDANFNTGDPVNTFAQAVQSGSDITIQVDVDGAGGGATWEDVAVLQGYGTSGTDQIKLAFENAEHTVGV